MDTKKASNDSTPERRPRHGAGLVARKACWVPTLFGWLLLGALLALSVALGAPRLERFLAVNDPLQTDVLVVEGWVSDAILQQAAQEALAHSYRHVITTGGPIEEGSYLATFGTEANLAAAGLRQLGVPGSEIEAVPRPMVRRNRTFQSGAALRRWLVKEHSPFKTINVLTVGPHARRTRLLFQKALGPEFRVGIIAAKDPDYEAKRWWASSQGVKSVLFEAFAYSYARVLGQG